MLVATTGDGVMVSWDVSTSEKTSLMLSHFSSVTGVSSQPTSSTLFASVGEDQQLFIWDSESMSCIKRKKLPHPGSSVDLAPSANRIAVGCVDGSFIIYSTAKDMRVVASRKHCKEEISVIAYSPNQKMLAVGSHDNHIDIYDTFADTYSKLSRCIGHSSYITHLDWSIDSEILQSNCGGM